MSTAIVEFASADDHASARYGLACASGHESDPEDPAPTFEEWQRDTSFTSASELRRRWGLFEGDELVAVGEFWAENRETNQHLGSCHGFVRPDRRGRGFARRLLAAAAEAAADDGRTVLGSWAVENSNGHQFLISQGFETKITERKSRLHTDRVDRELLEEWVRRAKERASEYSIVAWRDCIPDEHLEAYCRVSEVMNTAPRENLDMEDWKATPEHTREREERRRQLGHTRWTVCARHDPSGEFAGFTDITFSEHRPEIAWQGGTAVDPAHRNKGLGRWVKAVNCLRVLDERPEVRFIDTGNAFSNEAMLGINIAMGFELVRGYAELQTDTAGLLARLS